MLKQLERWMLFYDINISPNKEDAPSIPMNYLADQLLTRQQDGKSVKLINKDTAAIRINDIRVDKKNQLVFLLIQYSDTSISDPAFCHLETGNLRVEPKLEGEGIAVSAHLGISMQPHEPRGNTYIALLEEVPGISKSKIQPFLNSEFKNGSPVKYYDPNGKRKKCRALVDMYGHPSQSLVEDLKRGELRGIELINSNYVEKDFDERGYTKEVGRKLQLKLRKHYNGDEAVNVLKSVMKKARQEDYNDMRVKYHRWEGREKTVPINPRREDIAEQLFTRMERCKLSEPIPQCIAELNDEIVEKMEKYFHESRK